MKTVWFVYIGNNSYRDVVFYAYTDVNKYLAENSIPIRLIFHHPQIKIKEYENKNSKSSPEKDIILESKPGFTITINTGREKVIAYSLEGILDVLYGWLVKTRHEVQEIYERYQINFGDEIPDTVIGVVSFPLVTRNPYLDFYEKFLGVQKKVSSLNIIAVSVSPFYHPNKLKFSNRIFKAILHELGHAFGLSHCSENCVMNPPSTIEEWDSRVPDFCPKCFLELKRNVEWKENKRDNTSLQRGKENRESSSEDA